MMKIFRQAAFAMLAVVPVAAMAEKQRIERYQPIIDRQMFGPLPPDFDPDKMPSEVSRGSSSAAEKELTKEQEQLQSAVHFSVINIDRDGKPVVGFTDNSDPKAPVHYYMRVGESQNGWLVKEADPEKATMTIVKGEVEVALTLGDNSAKGGGKTSSANASAGGASHTPLGARGGLFGGSLSARRARRREAEQAEAQKREAEQAEKEAARQAQAEQEKAEREAERAQQRQQLLAIQEELRKAREDKERAAENGNGNNDAE